MSLPTLLTPLRALTFLFTPTFWTKTGFFISYIATFLLVLEVVRLASSDAKRKEVERLIDVYAAGRGGVEGGGVRRGSVGKGRREGGVQGEVDREEEVSVSIEELEDIERASVGGSGVVGKVSLETLDEMERRSSYSHTNLSHTHHYPLLHQPQPQPHHYSTPPPQPTRPRTPSPHTRRRRTTTTSPTEPEKRRKRSSSSPKPLATQRTASASPRRLRKRSDTVTSSISVSTSTPSMQGGGAVRRKERGGEGRSVDRERRVKGGDREVDKEVRRVKEKGVNRARSRSKETKSKTLGGGLGLGRIFKARA